MAAKATRAEIEQRVGEVYELLLTRTSHRTICRYASAKWNVTSRQTERYIGRARAKLLELAAIDQAEELAKAKGLYEQIIARQMAAADLRGARSTLDKLVELLGLASPSKLEVHDFSTYTEEQLLEVIVCEYPEIVAQGQSRPGRACAPARTQSPAEPLCPPLAH